MAQRGCFFIVVLITCCKLDNLAFFLLQIDVGVFFSNLISYSNNYYRNSRIVINGWDSDKTRHKVGPDLGRNWRQILAQASRESECIHV